MAIDSYITEARMARALRSGPPGIRGGAKVVDMDADGNMTVLQEGPNAWTCTPGVENASAAMCADELGMQWFDPFDRTSPLIPIGPHWMLIWPFTAEHTGPSTTMRDAGTMIMFAGTPYAHLQICGNPWEGNECHPDVDTVLTMTYQRRPGERSE
ncbi:hypothetical protein BH10ACT9_BH10ACT9_32140 [soil metagenome]